MQTVRIMGKVNLCTLFVILLSSLVECCPPPEDIGPLCKCLTGFSGDNVMHCHSLLSPGQLVRAMKALSRHKVKLYSLSIENSSLMYLPHSIFEGNAIEMIRFLNSEIMSLSDSDVAFSGLENTLTELRATAANYITHWDFQQLRNLKQLELIDVNHIQLGSISYPFPLLPKVTALGIIRAEISYIADSAFANLPKLTILNMKENDITELERSMFPNPAENLAILDFSHNKLSSLPEDFCDNMPRLSNLHLDNNEFMTLTEIPFLNLIRKIPDLTMGGNPFRCDCRMRWIAEAPIRTTLLARCASPSTVAGKNLKDLDIRDLWC